MSRPAGKHDSDAITPSATLKQTRWLRVLSTIHSSMERKDESGVWSDEKVVSVASRVKRISLATRLSCALEPRPRVRLHILWQNNKLTNVLSCLGVLLFAKAGSVSTQLSPHLGFPLWTCFWKAKRIQMVGNLKLNLKDPEEPKDQCWWRSWGMSKGYSTASPSKTSTPFRAPTHWACNTLIQSNYLIPCPWVKGPSCNIVQQVNYVTMTENVSQQRTSWSTDPRRRKLFKKNMPRCLPHKSSLFQSISLFRSSFPLTIESPDLDPWHLSFSPASPWHLAEVSPQEHHACLGVGVDLVELRLHLPSQHDNHSTFLHSSHDNLLARQTFGELPSITGDVSVLQEYEAEVLEHCEFHPSTWMKLLHWHCLRSSAHQIQVASWTCPPTSGSMMFHVQPARTCDVLRFYLTCINSAGTFSSCRSSSTSAQQLPSNSNFWHTKIKNRVDQTKNHCLVFQLLMNHEWIMMFFFFLVWILSICASHQDHGASCCSCSRCSCSSLLDCGHRGATRAHGELWDLRRHEIPVIPWYLVTRDTFKLDLHKITSLHGPQPTKHNKPRICIQPGGWFRCFWLGPKREKASP